MILLSDRKVLGLQGTNVKEFLNGMVTQNIKKLANNQACFAAFLTGQGRLVSDFIVYQKAEDFLLIDCHEKHMMPLAQALHKYDLNQEIEFHDLSDSYNVYVSLSDEKTSEISFNDPRHSQLGLRIFSTTEFENAEPLSAYHRARIKLGVPESAYDATENKTLPNELCFEELNGIDFEKGCYVGQELTARTKFRTLPKKRVMKIEFESAPTQSDEPLLITRDETREIGHCYSVSGNQGIAIVRIAELKKEGDFICDGQSVKLSKPLWCSYEI